MDTHWNPTGFGLRTTQSLDSRRALGFGGEVLLPVSQGMQWIASSEPEKGSEKRFAGSSLVPSEALQVSPAGKGPEPGGLAPRGLREVERSRHGASAASRP